jgi:hypothetical protein
LGVLINVSREEGFLIDESWAIDVLTHFICGHGNVIVGPRSNIADDIRAWDQGDGFDPVVFLPKIARPRYKAATKYLKYLSRACPDTTLIAIH